MIQIGDKLVSEALREEHFVCDLQACKGACCVEGDAGAPLSLEETRILDEIYPEVAPYLPEHARAIVAQQGKWVQEGDDYETPLVNGKECVYTLFEAGIALCGIEKAWNDGKVPFRKPISCHLYPIRINHLKSVEMDAVNYEEWKICKPACALGDKLRVPVYKFLRDPLTRKFGEAFYDELSAVFGAMDAMDKK